MSWMRNLFFWGLIFVFYFFLSPMKVQSGEIPARGPIPFTSYDKDSNGLVSEEEFNAVREERISTRAAEGRPMIGAAMALSFSEFDTNGDGQLTQDELLAGQKTQMEKFKGVGMRRGQGRGMRRGMGIGRNMPTFSEYDLDGDGKIVENEFNEARSKRISERVQQGYLMKNIVNAPSFSDIDTNGDGEISTEEFTAHQTGRLQQKTQ